MKIGNSEIFVISTNHNNIIYSPLSKTYRYVGNSTAKQLIDSIENNNRDGEHKEFIAELQNYQLPDPIKMLRQSPQEFTTLSLLPNLVCNFKCQYCYSAQGRSNSVIDKYKLKQALDFFIDPGRIEPQTIKMFISGGGEPFLSWDNTKYAISYAHERAKEYGFTLWASIITNGAVVNEEIIDTLKKYKCSVCVSFEILENIQNTLRGKYEKVASSITTYGEAGIPVMLNSTITPLSVGFMFEMAEEVLAKYPFVRNYTLEPVTDHTQFDSSGSLRDFYRQFGENYKVIKKKYSNSNTSFWFSMDEMLNTIKMRYCPGKLCLTPNSTFSICHCASSPLEERYEKCVYGEINQHGVTFDMEKFQFLINLNTHHRKECVDCFARWNCGGECMTRFDQYPKHLMDEVCRFNREWLTYQLEEQLDK